MKILGIESSCDETAAAVVEDGTRALSNCIASQVDIHARYGGIVPEVASRQHILAVVPIIRQAMAEAETDWQDIDAIAVTKGPGLAGSLIIGVNAAKAVSMARRIPLVGVNHLEGHIYANWLTPGARPEFPLIALIVSGGHSDIVLMKGHGDYTLLGRTRDDASGEAFDKAARILGLGYPGGPAIQKAAAGAAEPLVLPRAWIKGTRDFSFSGIKSALLRMVEKGEVPDTAGAAAGFQEAIVEVLVAKTVEAAREHRSRCIVLAGGVAANRALRERLVADSPLPVLIPEFVYCTDNPAMIATCGYFRFMAGERSGLDMDVLPGLKLA
jgi:N6-L-threonylcarbamoyladenine synthase